MATLLGDKDLEIIEPEVGELVTSFQMAGVSLTLFWLDEELEPLWRAAAYTPAYRKGSVMLTELASATTTASTESAPEVENEPATVVGHASEASRGAADVVSKALCAVKAAIDDNVEELGRLDAVAGDGDHGIGMQRGSTAAALASQQVLGVGGGAGTVLTRACDAWADRAGGTSGALWGIALRAIGSVFGDEVSPDGATVVSGVTEAQREIVRHGKAQLGDKTMLDSLMPFTKALEAAVSAGDDLVGAWGAASAVADHAAESTAALIPKIGRARPHSAKSVGTPDPGAVSMALIIRAVHQVLIEKEKGITP